MNGFDKFDEELNKHVKRTSRAMVIAICVNGVVSLVVIGGIVYLAIHFIKKIW